VQRVSIDAGFTCPNVDGTLATGGCTFCDNRSFSPSRRLPAGSITEQIDDGIRRLQIRYRCDQFMAYFQPASNTYAPVPRLRSYFEEAISHPRVVALAVGTRADCVPDDVLDLLEELAAKKRLFVEFGMQTMHDRSLEWMNRAETHDSMIDAMERSRGRGFHIGVHIMLGLPGESHDDMMATAAEVVRLGVDSVKIHNLYAVEGTPLADQVRRGEVRLMERDEYVTTLVDFLERLPPHLVIERISGEAPPKWFLGPQWALDKPAILRAVDEEFARRNSWQGKRA
jgi:radical SAM protein (TIGR01212 family)